MGENTAARFLLLTYPRSASNLLLRILAIDEQPNVAFRERGGYFFLPSLVASYKLGTRTKNVDEWTRDQIRGMLRSYHECFNHLESYLQGAEANDQIAFVKEHVLFMAEPITKSKFVFGEDSAQQTPWTVQVPRRYTSAPTHSRLNVTVLPDEFMKTFRPIFLIRHPALAFPSQYRTVIDNEGLEVARSEEAILALEVTLHWTRSLYDWYSQNVSFQPIGPGTETLWPLVVDADDIMKTPDVVQQLCEIVGLDSSKLRFSWAPATQDELSRNGPITNRMLSTLFDSSGIVQAKIANDIDVDAEAVKWRTEFGEHQGRKMEEWVRLAMPDYEFLKARRVKPNAIR